MTRAPIVVCAFLLALPAAAAPRAEIPSVPLPSAPLAPAAAASLPAEVPAISASLALEPPPPALAAGPAQLRATDISAIGRNLPVASPGGAAPLGGDLSAARRKSPGAPASERAFGRAQTPADRDGAALFDGARPGPTAPEPAPEAPQSPQPPRGPGQVRARLTLLALRAATLPAHAWPVTWLSRTFSHGEALAGLTPASAVGAARAVRASAGAGAVVGRLSWELHDAWSVRGAAASYARLIEELGRAKEREPGLDAAVSLDIEALGAQLDGLTPERKRAAARANVLRLARAARERGIPVELDAGASALLPDLEEIARAVVLELGVPVRLALPARYARSEAILRRWAALARATGLRLGVRLVKGSFVEADNPDAENRRGPLLDRYKRLITRALEEGPALDVAVATQNEEIWRHAHAESERLGAPFEVHAIRGVAPELQAKMRAAGDLKREYVSYGVDTPVMALLEAWTNWRHRRVLRRRCVGGLD